MKNKIPKGCLPFDIEAVKNGAKVVTRDGRDAEYIGESDIAPTKAGYPYLFKVGNLKLLFTEKGRFLAHNKDNRDLFLVDTKYMGTELPQEQPYEVTMIATPPTNPEFEFKQEIAAQFVRDIANSDAGPRFDFETLVESGLVRYKEFLKQCKERFSTTQAPE